MECWKGNACPSWAEARPAGEQCPSPVPSVYLSAGTPALRQERSAPTHQKGEELGPWQHFCGCRVDMIQNTDFLLNFKNFVSASASWNKATGVFYYFSDHRHCDYFSFNDSNWCLPAVHHTMFYTHRHLVQAGNCVRQVYHPHFTDERTEAQRD